jgi:hypothetical protein
MAFMWRAKSATAQVAEHLDVLVDVLGARARGRPAAGMSDRHLGRAACCAAAMRGLTVLCMAVPR